MTFSVATIPHCTTPLPLKPVYTLQWFLQLGPLLECFFHGSLAPANWGKRNLLVVGGTVLIRVVVAIVNIKTLDYLSIVQDTE